MIEDRVATAQTIASAEAIAYQSGTLSEPPVGCRPLTSIQSLSGHPMHTAIVLGYQLKRELVRDTLGPDGGIKYPGDAGYLDAHIARLLNKRIPRGWSFAMRSTMVLYALIDGCPILLEEHAREQGYPRALAVSPKWLSLGEVAC